MRHGLLSSDKQHPVMPESSILGSGRQRISATSFTGRDACGQSDCESSQEARQLAPALGERMLTTRFLDREVFMRELLPQDLKLEIDQISRKEAMKAAHYLAMVVGRAHARQIKAATRAEWHDELGPIGHRPWMHLTGCGRASSSSW